MKTVKFFFAPLGVAALLFVSCQKKEKEIKTESTVTKISDDSLNTANIADDSNTVKMGVSSDATNSNIDKMLDDYEKFVDQYVEYLLKATKGDATAMAEYPSLMKKAEELDNSLEKSKDDNKLTPEQVKDRKSVV